MLKQDSMKSYTHPLRVAGNFLILFLVIHLSAQGQCPPAPPNITIPCGGSTTLAASPNFTTYQVINTLCSPVAIAGTNAFPTACDDCVTGSIPIGFPFNFFGNIYSNCEISSNGLVGFGGMTFAGFTPFTIPAGGLPDNYIAGIMCDIDIRCGGTITYQTIGVAPNRRFVISYNNVASYGGGLACTGIGTASFQIILNEDNTFNVIISNYPANWNSTTSGVLATSGAENFNGAYAYPVPGRNAQDFRGIVPGNQDCRLFTPTTCAFQRWQVAGATVSGTASYTVSPSITTTYTALWSCGGTTCSTTTTVTVPTSPITTSAAVCQGGTGTLTAAASCGTAGTPIAIGSTFNSSELTYSSPTWNRNGTGTICNGVAGGDNIYEALPFTVNIAGTYVLDMCSGFDSHASLYQNAFNGANPCGTPSNFIIANDDDGNVCSSLDPRITANLVPGVTYYLVSTSFGINTLGAFSWQFTSGPAGSTLNAGGASGVMQWYTAPTGGTPIAAGSPFNPVGVVGSGLINTNTPGTYTYYAACSSSPTCRTATNFVITTNSTPPTSITGTGVFCNGTNATLGITGGTLVGAANWEWFSGSCGGTALGTGATLPVTPTVSTNYFVRASSSGGCPASACTSGTITLPPAGTALANNNESATCVVNQNGYVHFYHSSGRLICSINSQGQNLGNVTVTAYTGAPVDMPACNFPSMITTALGRHWVITPQNQPVTAINVALHFDQSEFTTLSTQANGNTNPFDNVSVIGDLLLSKYSGPLNVDGLALNNCTSAGGSGGTTTHLQAINGNTSTMLPGFSATARFTRHDIISCSEFWLNGMSNLSPLATELVEMSGECRDNGSVEINWTTASENNCFSYVLNRYSLGNGYWEEIYNIDCAVYSQENKYYSFIDQDRKYDLTSYQLVEEDLNGVKKILQTIQVSCESSNERLIIYPNPAQNYFSIQIENDSKMKEAKIWITELSGKIIESKSVSIFNGTTMIPFSTIDYSEGTYLVFVQQNDEQSTPLKLVVTK